MLWSRWFWSFLWFPFSPVFFFFPDLFWGSSKRIINNWNHLYIHRFFVFFSALWLDPSICLSFRFLSVGVSPIDGLVLMWHIPTKLSSSQSRFCLSESLPRAVIFLIVRLERGFSQQSFVYVLFAFNIFLISVSCHHLNLPLTTTLSFYLRFFSHHR